MTAGAIVGVISLLLNVLIFAGVIILGVMLYRHLKNHR